LDQFAGFCLRVLRLEQLGERLNPVQKEMLNGASERWLPGSYFHAYQSHQAAALFIEVKTAQRIQQLSQPLPGRCL
jgi:hypothetical protein